MGHLDPHRRIPLRSRRARRHDLAQLGQRAHPHRGVQSVQHVCADRVGHLDADLSRGRQAVLLQGQQGPVGHRGVECGLVCGGQGVLCKEEQAEGSGVGFLDQGGEDTVFGYYGG